MGSDYTHTVFSADQMQDERPAHEQCFDVPFWIDLTEMTQGNFDRLGGVSAREDSTAGEQHPVVRISWFEASDFCALRDARLPTEAEWEYAARGADSLVYPWGSEMVSRNAVRQPDFITDVGTIPAGASWVGALDMSGNVWEWTSSLIMPYPYDAEDGREDDTAETSDGRRVVRGGVAENNARILLRSSSRFSIPADEWDSITGLRCARSLGTSP
jgi:iron(II)-dependent oxidoreductase